MNIGTRVLDLPSTIRAFVVRSFDDDAYYTVVLNARMNAEQQKQAYQHEIDHIYSGDFISCAPPDLIESVRHL